MTDELRVEKRQEQVGLFMADGVIFEGTVFLAQFAMNHSGEQRVLDLLLEADRFLPMRPTDGSFQLVCKGMISHVRCTVVQAVGLEYTERQVRISFLGNEVLQGIVKMDSPAHSARLTDYINRGDEFFPLFSGEHSYLVNRTLIRDVTLLD
jgi:hypothetical protein